MTVTHWETQMNQSLTIRYATESDRPALTDLAALDSQPAPSGDAVLAFVGESLVAALPLDGGPALADPFRNTAAIVEMLEVRAAQRSPGRRRRWPVLRPRVA
jgi:hypothetical protein